jgi:two-component system response regulator HydG
LKTGDDLIAGKQKDCTMMSGENECVRLVAIDDDPAALELIAEALSQEGVEILTTTTAADGLELVLQRHPEIVLLDLMMPDVSGMELLDKIVEASPTTDVILVTGKYSTESAVEAIRRGASDYITKPISISGLRERVGNLIAEASRGKRALQLDGEILKTFQFEGMVGRSPLMLEMYRTIRRVAPHFRSALVIGETGTGKELVAGALHRLSPVASRRMITCNCSAIVETLFESELFGHVRGSFTGATNDKVGMIEYASGGTLFLDEIGDMPLQTQVKLLRAVETGEFQRVGSPSAHKADVRIIAATNRDLRKFMESGQFREDLYYRLSMVEIRVPRLADRKEDLNMLERYFVDKFAHEYGKAIRRITPRAQIVLSRCSWPGNVRELENVLGHACMMAESDVIDVKDLPETIRKQPPPEHILDDNLVSLAEMHSMYVHRVLEKTGGNKARAARILGINRATLYRFLKETVRKDDSSVTEIEDES